MIFISFPITDEKLLLMHSTFQNLKNSLQSFSVRGFRKTFVNYPSFNLFKFVINYITHIRCYLFLFSVIINLWIQFLQKFP